MPLPGALSRIIHPTLLASLESFHYGSTVTIQANTPTNNEGVLVDSWANVAGLVDLECTVSPASQRGIELGERRVLEPNMTKRVETHHVSITGYFTNITNQQRAVVTTAGSETLTLDILAVEHDSQAQTTRLRAEVVSN